MRQRKGQSAADYLLTYGWAVLAIVVVAGVLWNMGLFGGGYEPSDVTEPEYLQLRADEWTEVCVEYENEYVCMIRYLDDGGIEYMSGIKIAKTFEDAELEEYEPGRFLWCDENIFCTEWMLIRR